MKKNTAINFLLYSYFGITLVDNDKACVFACIMKAYFDATNQGAYNTQIKELHKESNETKIAAASYLYKRCLTYFTQQACPECVSRSENRSCTGVKPHSRRSQNRTSDAHLTAHGLPDIISIVTQSASFLYCIFLSFEEGPSTYVLFAI